LKKSYEQKRKLKVDEAFSSNSAKGGYKDIQDKGISARLKNKAGEDIYDD
jgi:hypothetical protein